MTGAWMRRKDGTTGVWRRAIKKLNQEGENSQHPFFIKRKSFGARPRKPSEPRPMPTWANTLAGRARWGRFFLPRTGNSRKLRQKCADWGSNSGCGGAAGALRPSGLTALGEKGYKTCWRLITEVKLMTFEWCDWCWVVRFLFFLINEVKLKWNLEEAQDRWYGWRCSLYLRSNGWKKRRHGSTWFLRNTASEKIFVVVVCRLRRREKKKNPKRSSRVWTSKIWIW